MTQEHKRRHDLQVTAGVKDSILAGIKVVELAQNAAIPQCGRILAGMGADVVKVEPPGGDAMQGIAYAAFNPGKRSMALDLGSPDALEIIDRLFTWADVALVAFKQKDLKRFGIDWDRARTINPRLIHLTHTPFGPEGPIANEGGYDVLVQALSGMGFTMNRSEDGVPLPTRPAVNDFGTGIAGALGVVAALRHRDLNGEGQRVDVSLLATALSLATPTVSRLYDGDDPGQLSESESSIKEMRDAGSDFDEIRTVYEGNTRVYRNFRLYFRHYATADGLVTIAGLSRGLFAKFHEITGLEQPTKGDMPNSPHFQTIVQQAEELFASATTDEWLTKLRAVGYPCGRYNLPFEALNDPQVRANWFVSDLEHPTLGNYSTSGLPVQFSAAPVSLTQPSPTFASHTVEMLTELGISDERIQTLVENRTVVSVTSQT